MGESVRHAEKKSDGIESQVKKRKEKGSPEIRMAAKSEGSVGGRGFTGTQELRKEGRLGCRKAGKAGPSGST